MQTYVPDAQDGVYPTLRAELIENPNKFWAIPFVGIICKEIILIPIVIELMILQWVVGIMQLVNSFVVLFTGVYWAPAYELTLGLARLTLKTQFFAAGLTDKYPGFDLTIDDRFSLDIAMPTRPNQLYAFPILGAIIRSVLIIPYAIFLEFVALGASVGVLISFVPVLSSGRYPEFAFELYRDTARLTLATMFYFAGISDQYPSFSISMDHKNEKIILIAIGAVAFLIYLAVGISTGGSSGSRSR